MIQHCIWTFLTYFFLEFEESSNDVSFRRGFFNPVDVILTTPYDI